MNKTIQVNLCGQSFTMDDNAYEELSAYINDLKTFYASEEGVEEIIADIEARFAEVFAQKLEKQGRQIVALADVKACIEAMGRPEDFESAGESQANNHKAGPGASFGKRMYRDPDNKIIGGVSSGLAAYFGVGDPVWIRILFILLAWFGGGGLLIYIILWFILPEAKSTSQKLEMRGEPVNLSNLEKSVKEEVTGAGKNIKSFVTGNEAKSALNRGVNTVGDIVGKIVTLIGVIIKGFIYFLGGVLLFAAAITLMALVVASVAGMPVASLIFFDSALHSAIAMSGLILFLGVPLIILLYLPIRLLFKKKVQSNVVGLSLLATWIIGLLLVSYSTIDGVAMFSKEHQSRQVHVMEKPDTLYLTMNFLGEATDFENISWGDLRYLKSKEYWVMQNIELDVVQNPDSTQVEVVQHQLSRGRDRDAAKAYAEAIQYQVQVDGDTLRFDDVFTFGDPKKFRHQRVRLTLKIPENTFVIFGPGLQHIVDDVPLGSQRGIYDDATVYEMQNGMLYATGMSSTPLPGETPDLNQYAMRKVGNVDAVNVSGFMRVHIMHGETPGLYVHRDVELQIISREKGGELSLSRKQGQVKIMSSRRSNRTFDCVVVMPEISSLKLTGSVKVQVDGYTEQDLKAKLSGVSELTLQGIWDRLDLQVAGSSKVQANGSSTSLDLELGGASHFFGQNFTTVRADVDISGASRANFEVQSTLKGEVSGASSLEYRGQPNADVQSSGASRVRRGV